MTCLSKAQAFIRSQNLKICAASGSKPFRYFSLTFSLLEAHPMAIKIYFVSVIHKKDSSLLTYFCLVPYQVYFSFRGKPYVSCSFSSYVNIRKRVKTVPSVFSCSWIKVYISTLHNKDLKVSTMDLAENIFLGKAVCQDIYFFFFHGLSTVLFS